MSSYFGNEEKYHTVVIITAIIRMLSAASN